ncbi:MAG: DUF58 domain-containing protein [Solobacterium sp.]|nr:DUF58 domain-containing protein [Solobacterium sp.]
MQEIHIEDIEESIHLHTKKKSSNLFDGTFRSLFHGRSLEFDDLREYHYGDDVHDIDWKASSRSDKTLIRKNIAEKKHYLVFVLDHHKELAGHTPKNIEKSTVLTQALGILAYLLKEENIDYALLYGTSKGIELTRFSSTEEHLENCLHICNTYSEEETKYTLNDLLIHCLENIPRRLFLVTLSDVYSLKEVDKKIIGELEEKNDVFSIVVRDALLTSPQAYDLQEKCYAEEEFLYDASLEKIEQEEKEKLEIDIKTTFLQEGARCIFIEDEESYYTKLEELFQGQDE